MAQWPNQRISPDAGSWHGSEIPSVFGFPDSKSAGLATPEQSTVSKFMNKAWAEFAKDPENGLSRLGLPVYDPQGMFFLSETMGRRVEFL